MANMFSGNHEKKVPKNLRECYQSDSITYNLWEWCERLENWGFIICVFLAIAGVISIFSNAMENAELLKDLDITLNGIQSITTKNGIEIKSTFRIIIEDTLLWLWYCLLEYCAYHVLALLIASLASIVQHTKITANIALYNTANASFKNETNKIFTDYDKYEHNPPKYDNSTLDNANQNALNYFKNQGKDDVDKNDLEKYYKEEQKEKIKKIITLTFGVLLIGVLVLLFINS